MVLLSRRPVLRRNENGTEASWRRQAEKGTTEETRSETGTEKGGKEMSLVPVDRSTGRKRPVSEAERARLRKQKEKADWHKRNPDSKWNKR